MNQDNKVEPVAVIKNIPQKIYLVLGLDKDELQPDEDFNDFEEVAWCSNRVSEADIEYVISQSLPVEQLRWVSVKDRLPDEDEEVIIFWCKHGDPKGARAVSTTAWYANKKWHLMDSQDGLINDIENTPDMWVVTHWMEKPDEPNEEVKGQPVEKDT